MTRRTEAALRRFFATSAIAETDRLAGAGMSTLRRKGLITSERALGNYWRWKHELTAAGRTERDRVVEVARG